MNKFGFHKWLQFGVVVFSLLSSPVYGNAQALPAQKDFTAIKAGTDWKLAFFDAGTGNWQEKWFLDGYRATVGNATEGMLFSAGPVDGDDACHAVLWTKKSFAGDIKITYDYTRTDAYNKWVNILYIQATGIDSGQYVKDIFQWRQLRMIPSMQLYFNYMKALHISYAAYGKTLNEGPDYVRARVYPKKEGAVFASTTELPPTYENTQLFLPGKTYQITIIKKAGVLYMQVAGNGADKLFTWNISGTTVTEGRIGLRHMFTRSALYKNFRVYTAQ